jgi:hypothetical protein
MYDIVKLRSNVLRSISPALSLRFPNSFSTDLQISSKGKSSLDLIITLLLKQFVFVDYCKDIGCAETEHRRVNILFLWILVEVTV